MNNKNNKILILPVSILLLTILFLTTYNKKSVANLESTTNSFNNNQPIQILPLGDSITQGGHGHPSYRRYLWQMLRKEGHHIDFIGSQNTFQGYVHHDLQDFDIDHEGHWGWEAGWLARYLPKWLKNYTPDIVLLHAGTNDVDRGQSHLSTMDELNDIINLLRNKNPKVIILLAKIIPMQNKTTSHFNKKIESFAAITNTFTSPIVIVDHYTGYNPLHNNYDKYHPNKQGEIKMATQWFNALQPYLAKPQQ